MYLGNSGGDEIFIGRDFATQKGYSEELCAKVDAAIRDIITTADQRAFDILTEKKEILDNLAEVLLDMEKITGAQFEKIYNGKTLADFKAEENIQADSASSAEEPATEPENTLEG